MSTGGIQFYGEEIELMRRLIVLVSAMLFATAALLLVQPMTRSGEAWAFDKKKACCAATATLHSHLLNEVGQLDNDLAVVVTLNLDCGAQPLGSSNTHCKFDWNYSITRQGDLLPHWGDGDTILVACGDSHMPIQVVAKWLNDLQAEETYVSRIRVHADLNCDGDFHHSELVIDDQIHAIP